MTLEDNHKHRVTKAPSLALIGTETKSGVAMIFPILLILQRKKKQNALALNFSELIGTVQKEIHPMLGGRIRTNGSEWPAKTMKGETISVGAIVQIVARQGITLIVEPLVSDVEQSYESC